MFSFTANAQQNYDVSLIPKELLSHASAVIRNNEIAVDVKSLDGVNQHVKYAVTVFNKNGDNEAGLTLEYNKLNQIKYIKGIVYNEQGVPVSKIAERDFKDESVADGYSLFIDDRVKVFRPAITTYPYTVEYEYETHSKQSLFLPDWEPTSIGVSTQHSSYKLICKPDFNIRYKEINYSGKVILGEAQGGLKTYTWEINNVKAKRYEPYSPVNEKLFTSVKIAPEKFSYSVISGSFTNWQEYGQFIYDKLVKDRRQLPEETVAYIKDLTKDITDPKLKAKKIYEFMQQKTRYVSVDIGIGGYQPFLASDVDKQSYGDCKALVNYTQALLNAVGINSYYILVKCGESKINAMPDFASMNQFSHAILCLPFKNDTTWLECTDKEIPFGFLGDFTDDRNVVACTPEGGKLMHTPKYTAADNKQTRKGTFTIDSNGELSGDMQTRFEGTQYENREKEGIINEAYTEQIKKLKEIYPLENLDIISYKLTQDKKIQPVTTETIKLRARDYVAQNGDRFFFLPNTASRYIRPLQDITNRINDVYINRGYLDEDEITYNLPDGFRIDSKLLNLTIDKPFGKYITSTEIKANKLIYKRKLQINDGTFSKDIYPDMVDFYQTVYEADNYTLTMVKK